MGSVRGDVGALVATAWRLDRHRVLAQMVLLVVGGVVGGVGLAMLVPIVNAISGPDGAVVLPVVGTLGVGGVALWVLLVAFVALVATGAGIQRTSAVNAARLQQRVVDSLRHDAFAAVLAAQWSFVVGMRRSDVIGVVTLGASRSGLAVSQLITTSVAVVLALATAAIAVVVNPLVAGLAIVGVVVMAAAQATGIRPAHRLGRLLGERNREVQAVVGDSLDSLRLARAHDASGVWVDRLAAAFGGAREVQIANTERMSTVSALTSVGSAAAAATLVGVAVWAGMEPAAIVVIVVLVGRLSGQVSSIVRNLTMLANSLPAVGDITQLTAAARAACEVPDGAHSAAEHPHLGASSAGSSRLLGVSEGAPLLELRGVHYTYPSVPYRPVAGWRDAATSVTPTGGVSGVDLVVRRGRVTALTGPSGAGKSTTADLALGLLRPDAGEVLVGGRPLGPGDLAWWRSHVAYVPQESLLLSGTLRDNLVWSTPRVVSDEECRDALVQAAAHFVDRLPDGLDTWLGDRGVRLSGGERQRVAIARALLRRPALLVLDEATSSLDDDTEAEVLDTIGSLVPAVTVLVIAHRRTTLALADEVVRLPLGAPDVQPHPMAPDAGLAPDATSAASRAGSS